MRAALPLNEPLAPALAAAPEGLDWLVRILSEGLDPQAALAALGPLRARHPGVELDLVWETEDYSGSVHYDLLIEAPGAGTLSLSVAPESAVPWPLRNAVRATDNVIARVNGRPVSVADAMQSLDALWGQPGLIERLIDIALVEQATSRLGVTVSDGELAAGVVAFRQEHGLRSAASTVAWLEARGMSASDLDGRIRAELLERKLREAVVGEGWRAWLEAHGAELDEVQIARVRLPDREEAELALAELRAGRRSLMELAELLFLRGDPSARAPFNTLRRRALSAEQADALFSASPGELVGPLRSGDGWDVIKIYNIKHFILNDMAITMAKRAVFEGWLAEQRRRASIVWFWGDPERMKNQNAGWAA